VRARVLVPLVGPAPNVLRLEGAALHHLRVLRVAPGDVLEVFDGRGRAWPAEVLAVAEDGVRVRLGAETHAPAGRPVAIVQALPKADKLELVLQKGTELGADAFYPALSAHSLVRLTASAAEQRRVRWQRIADEAARQSGRRDTPAVHPVLPLLEAVGRLPPGTRVLLLDEREEGLRLGPAADAGGVEAPLALVVGPEGGFSEEERTALHRLGATSVSLGQRVLRTETAALAALAVLRHREGSLG
jgi:16S rRNA (uracil1498-N3)-methyltransferase